MKNIAIIGLGCRYPDAKNHQELWQNILSKRQAFRKIPESRLSKAYFSEQATDPDKIYSHYAAVFKNYFFERENMKISKEQYNAADLSHWLALEVASKAIADSGILETALPLDDVGVFVGNTLTGEFSRANVLRIRWPYFEKKLAAQLKEEGWESKDIEDFLIRFEPDFKKSFMPMTQDSLAGGLSNTIAGRICNYFDFKGGGYTVDGACSSSLLAVQNGCNAILNDDLKCAVVGGVDLSIDPFELVGFSRTEALAKKRMLVYDKNANGFWPGEGCGFILLMDAELAQSLGLNVYAIIKGWGISTDGIGGLTRPKVDGQILAMKRAYDKAGYGIDAVSYIEGHGTGTKVGDEVELSTILKAIKNTNKKPVNGSIALGSVKSNIGHTKAASGIAGLIKSILVIHHKIIPPHTGVNTVHDKIKAESSHLKLLSEAQYYQADSPLRTSVSSMGFGGINVHLTLEEPTRSVGSTKEKTINKRREEELFATKQKHELLLLTANNSSELKSKINNLDSYVHELSFSEISDLSKALFENINAKDLWRLAIITNAPEDLKNKIQILNQLPVEKWTNYIDVKQGIFLNQVTKKSKIGLVFPGQGRKIKLEKENIWLKRFPEISRFFKETSSKEEKSTLVAQPAITNASLAGINVLKKLNVQPSVGVGHSLGEIAALHWNGVLTEKQTLKIVSERARIMHESSSVKGEMLSVLSEEHKIKNYVDNVKLSIASINTPTQTVISGDRFAINSLKITLKDLGIPAVKLNVENAFHSPLMDKIKPVFKKFLQRQNFNNPEESKAVYSTVTGDSISANDDVCQILEDQLTEPVKFYEAISKAEPHVDYWIEMGMDETMSKMIDSISTKPVASLKIFSTDEKGLLNVAGLLFVHEPSISLTPLFENRFFRPFDLQWNVSFLTNPCESTTEDFTFTQEYLNKEKKPAIAKEENPVEFKGNDILANLKVFFAERLDLPVEKLKNSDRMLDDLRLNSLAVIQMITDFTNKRGIKSSRVPTEYANASFEEIASILKDKQEGGIKEDLPGAYLQGIKSWLRPFKFSFVELPLKKQVIPIDLAEKGNWHLCYSGKKDFCFKVLDELSFISGKGILLGLFTSDEKENIKTILEWIDLVKSISGLQYCVVLQSEEYCSGFMKSFFLEHPEIRVCVINIEKNLDPAFVPHELFQEKGFSEVFYDGSENRLVPFFDHYLLKDLKSKDLKLKKKDVVLVIGGGKGITAECAHLLSTKTGARLAILGRSNPFRDEALKRNLDRFRKEGVDFEYFSVDITNIDEVKAGIQGVLDKCKTITGVLYGAGFNQPIPVLDLDEEKINKTLAPKLEGFRNVMSLLNLKKLKLVVTFGSIIAQSGMKGNADYALANQWLNNEIKLLSKTYSRCRFLNLEWSVWSGVGMGQNLNVLENLIDEGIYPINIDKGTEVFWDILNTDLKDSSVILSARHGYLSTLNIPKKEIPAFRFVENIKLFYPQIELIASFTLSDKTDHYLKDHSIDGQFIFPAVFAIEAMTQAVAVLLGAENQVDMEDLQFKAPIILEAEEKMEVQLIAHRNEDKSISVVLRSEQTNFQQDSFSAIFQPNYLSKPKLGTMLGGEPLAIDIAKDLYGNLLFHEGKFQRLSKYIFIDPYNCIAEARSNNSDKWYSPLMPDKLLLGDPGVRDAALHAIQACVPENTLLPTSVKQFSVYKIQDKGIHVITAHELRRTEDCFVYDILVQNKKGKVLEFWKDVTFTVMKKHVPPILSFALLQLILQRRIDELLLEKEVCEIIFNLEDDRGMYKRADGHPYLPIDFNVSKSKIKNYSLHVISELPVACDIEVVDPREEQYWASVFTEDRFALVKHIEQVNNENIAVSTTRVWGAMECLKKSSEDLLSPIILEKRYSKNCVLLKSGNAQILSWCSFVREVNQEVTVSILIKQPQK